MCAIIGGHSEALDRGCTAALDSSNRASLCAGRCEGHALPVMTNFGCLELFQSQFKVSKGCQCTSTVCDRSHGVPHIFLQTQRGPSTSQRYPLGRRWISTKSSDTSCCHPCLGPKMRAQMRTDRHYPMCFQLSACLDSNIVPELFRAGKCG